MVDPDPYDDPRVAQAAQMADQDAQAAMLAQQTLDGIESIRPALERLAGRELPDPQLICPFVTSLTDYAGTKSVQFDICRAPDTGEPVARIGVAGRSLILSIPAASALADMIRVYTEPEFIAALFADGSDGGNG